jgi:hypothetical protein
VADGDQLAAAVIGADPQLELAVLRSDLREQHGAGLGLARESPRIRAEQEGMIGHEMLCGDRIRVSGSHHRHATAAQLLHDPEAHAAVHRTQRCRGARLEDRDGARQRGRRLRGCAGAGLRGRRRSAEQRSRDRHRREAADALCREPRHIM